MTALKPLNTQLANTPKNVLQAFDMTFNKLFANEDEQNE